MQILSLRFNCRPIPKQGNGLFIKADNYAGNDVNTLELFVDLELFEGVKHAMVVCFEKELIASTEHFDIIVIFYIVFLSLAWNHLL